MAFETKPLYYVDPTIRYWCHAILPLIYDDSLSYYEFLSKFINMLQEIAKSVDTQNDNIAQFEKDMQNAFDNFEDTQEAKYKAYKDQIDAHIAEFENTVNGNFTEFTNTMTAAFNSFKAEVEATNSQMSANYTAFTQQVNQTLANWQVENANWKTNTKQELLDSLQPIVQEALNTWGGVKSVKLWENADASADFAGQIVAISNIASYTSFVVEFLVDKNAEEISATVAFPSGQTVGSAQYTDMIYSRKFSVVASGMQFSDGSYLTIGDATSNEDNTIMIPLKIFGQTGVDPTGYTNANGQSF
mgnify:CR=1 FL=1|jgi:hypothetical protein